ncbi:MAG: glycosyl transferase [Firmicutes bacterium HGW-Firmicutes-18]|nr:MAG: glycosyl transferase [Firmicutes bacterium HGW-Firmicutes-18]
MLFRKNRLPSISIVAPAFNEEKNIISSVKSLLNLKYPDYELIVVNDGSTDSTLNLLISTFQLIRTDYLYKTSLSTAPVRGVYRNSNLPNLVVVDKSNGGKADSLNTGINVANNEYFCGIDADSLLESEALLKLASLTLDETAETPALGGNILPINNCKVDNGQIQEIHVPNNLVARLQTIEYLRAFMIGRLGWQQIKSMLIISGAFGLFRKERIIGIGGYLTSKGIYHKDTVGEDMELVVRISRMLREMKQKFVTLYAFNANCWTEVPEDLKSLKNQRYRWQRGLVDILFYHKKMMFHKSYGVIGLIAMPYFFIFETLGPIFEIQGYLLVVLAGILGILNTNVAIMLFISAVLIGVINSLVALLIAERETQYFSLRDLSRLVIIAIAENFGPRQWISFWRVLGQFQVIFGQGDWGKVKRRGI